MSMWLAHVGGSLEASGRNRRVHARIIVHVNMTDP